MRRTIPALFSLLCPIAPAFGAEYVAVKAFPKLAFEEPLFLTAAPGQGDRLFVVLQEGRVLRFPNRKDAEETITLLDIRDRVRRSHNEEGLLGFAFHPEWPTKREFFTYSSRSWPRRTVLSRFRAGKDWQKADKDKEEVLLEIRQPYGNHNGGMLAFGPDGFLYVAVGDGGAAGDPHGNAQDLETLLGKILRIDISRTEGRLKYAVPADNPFAGRKGVRGEIWAYGLRNPWRFSFDRETGELWAGDVGQNKWEEVDFVVKGGNYGWNVREGAHPFRAMTRDGLIDPVVDHGRDDAQSLTGGYVYRGKKFPELRGAYIYGDFMTGHIWMLMAPGGKVAEHRKIARGQLISSFGEDAGGELYWTSFDGSIYTLERTGGRK